ncbi:MAG TPA: kelch repeat-containing protein, partial [Dongiaceae bacterium]|nr:kelch repeat-containing protein [Dongiaceae bacterium]
PAADRWAVVPAPLPTPREHLAAVALDGRLYVVGGRRRDQGNLAVLEVFDSQRQAWSRSRDMPTPRGGITAAALDGRIHVTGGEAFNPGRTFDAHEVYDPASDTWNVAAPLPTARHGLASGVATGRWHVIGGGTKAGMLTVISLSDRVETFTPDAGAP